MSKHPAATREHHDDFCVTEKWELVRGATGKPVRHHRTYELGLWDGRILRTRISKPVDSSVYSKAMWSHILREQLCVSTDEFWGCVNDEVLPDRGAPALRIGLDPLPLYLVKELGRYGVGASELDGLTPAQAQDLLNERIEAAD